MIIKHFGPAKVALPYQETLHRMDHPAWLKGQLRMITGNPMKTLEPLLKKLHEIDFFLHDSEHSYPRDLNLIWRSIF